MRIAIVTPNPVTFPGGAEKVTAALVDVLVTAGYDVEVFDRTRIGKGEATRGLLQPKLFGDFVLAHQLGSAFNRERARFDLVICNGMFGWNVSAPRVIAIAHGTIGGYLRATGTSVGLFAYFKMRTLDTWFHNLSFRNRTVVAVSGRAAEECRAYHGVKRTAVIGNPVDIDRFGPAPDRVALRRALGLPEDEFLGLYCGRPVFMKGVDVLRELLPMLPAGHRMVAALPSGSVDAPNLIARVGVPHDEMPALYAACDYLFFPTRYEGASLVLAEALATGLPVLTTRAGTGTDLAGDDLLGRFIHDDDRADRYRADIEALAADPALRSELGNRGRDWIHRNCSPQAFAHAYLELVEAELTGAELTDADRAGGESQQRHGPTRS
ncbi:MAG: glycosyltransferase family 4 protein [Candidatus Eisenbacteria bacterium]|uniref:Glycosyltransferase family 4 protein n=1 Tax=Eiseniibacteriota bacterium TaxID=2212470 RepID=A0A956LWJ3_UNCEI|nr:glycosyltransferase family 4 protein [Candidatus Eisenbacteria bacterium]